MAGLAMRWPVGLDTLMCRFVVLVTLSLPWQGEGSHGRESCGTPLVPRLVAPAKDEVPTRGLTGASRAQSRRLTTLHR